MGSCAGYKSVVCRGVTELACLAHIRRKFFDVHAVSGSAVVKEVLHRIAALYVIERKVPVSIRCNVWRCAKN